MKPLLSSPERLTPIDELTPRRLELLQLLAKGLTNAEIAKALSITPGTVRAHVTTLLSQLDVANRTEAAAVYVAWEARPAQVAAVLQRPAIAVLPIVPLADDPRTRTVAAGLTEDLASLFSRWCWFPVIATSTTAIARGLGVSTREVGAQLGARFLVDGTLRGSGPMWRLSLHIDDTESGHTLWSEQRDYVSEGVFEVQDAICQAIVAAAYPVLVARAQEGLPHARPAAQLAAWELAHDGMALRGARDVESNIAAIARFRDAITKEPDLVLAHYGMGLASYDAVLNQWGAKETALDGLLSSAEHCLESAPHAAEGHYLLARYLQSKGEWERAVGPLETAVGRNPSFALAHQSLSQSLQIVGRSDEALVRMKHAVRLGPRSFVAGLSTLHFMRGEYTASLETAERAIVTNPRYPFARMLAAASSWWLGEYERGRSHLAHLRHNSPQFRPQGFLATFGEKVESVERLVRAIDSLSRSR